MQINKEKISFLKEKSLLKFKNLLESHNNYENILNFRYYVKQKHGEIIGYPKPILINNYYTILELRKKHYTLYTLLYKTTKENKYIFKDYNLNKIMKIFKNISLLDLQFILIHIKK
jgi:hypothetical protein